MGVVKYQSFMKYGVVIMKENIVYKTLVVDATSYDHALFLARMEKKNLYNAIRRAKGKGIIGLTIYIEKNND